MLTSDEDIEILSAPARGFAARQASAVNAAAAASGSGAGGGTDARREAPEAIVLSDTDVDDEDELPPPPMYRVLKQNSFVIPLETQTYAWLSSPPPVARGAPSSSKAKGKARMTTEELDEMAMDIGVEPPSRKRSLVDGKDTQKSKAPKLSEEDKADKKRKAEQLRAEKLCAKAAEAAIKAAQKSANVLVNDRNDSIKELTVHLSGAGLPDANFPVKATTGKGRAKSKASVWISICQRMQEQIVDVGGIVEYSGCERSVRGSEGSVKWTRFCEKRWNSDLARFEPIEAGREVTIVEAPRLVFMTALELSRLVADGQLLAHVQAIKNGFSSTTSLFLMVYGLDSLFRTIVNRTNAEHTQRVRESEQGTSDVFKAKGVGIGALQPTREELEMGLMRVQMHLRLKLIHVDKEEEASTWLFNLSMDIGAAPYQHLKRSYLIALGRSGKVPTGKDEQDTFIKMLSELRGVTTSYAEGIVAEYKTLRNLFEAYRACSTSLEEDALLLGIRKVTNKDGTSASNAMGAALSARVARVFCGRDGDAFVT